LIYNANTDLWEVAMPSISSLSLRHLSGFRCWKCGGLKAYRSRSRGFFERYLLPLLLLKPVRCERCFHRVYVLRMVSSVQHVVPSGNGAAAAAVSAVRQRIA
jgi:hypothetical protein